MSKAITASVLSFLLAVWLIVWQIREIPGRTLPLVSTDLARKVLGKTMTSLTFTWTSAAGAHSLTTTQLPDESLRDFIDRHEAAIKAAQQAFPPI